MSKLSLIILIAVAILLLGASAVLAQDSTQTTPGAAINTAICPTAGNNIEQMQKMHDAMGQNVPQGMQQMHDAMGEALKNGDAGQVQQMHNICRNQQNSQ